MSHDILSFKIDLESDLVYPFILQIQKLKHNCVRVINW